MSENYINQKQTNLVQVRNMIFSLFLVLGSESNKAAN